MVMCRKSLVPATFYLVFICLLVVGFSPVTAMAQKASQFPVPEYYGVYVLEDVKLLGIDVSWSTYTPHKTQFRVLSGGLLGFGASVKRADVVQLSSGVRFLFYFESSGIVSPMIVASRASLRPVYFKRRRTTWNGGERPPRLEKTESVNYWSVRDEQIELLMKPIQGQPQLVIASAPAALSAGVYQFSVGDAVLFFTVGSLDSAQQSQCFDEAATYVIAMWSYKLIPCADSAPPAQPVPAPSPSPGRPAVAQPELTPSAKPSSTPQPSAASTLFFLPADSLTGVGPVGWFGRNADFEPTPVHLGIDFVRQYGQPISSIAEGEIVLANTSVGSYGGVGREGGAMIVKYKTDSGQTFYALYGHLENMKGPGCVGRGEQVGTIGHYFQKDGRDTPHLHFGIFFGDHLPMGNKWPWQQYVSDPSDAPGWQDPLFVLKNMRSGPLPCDSVSQAQTAEESRPDVAPPKVIAPPTPERQIQRFRVKHRHMGPDARGNVSFAASYCEGELRVTPEGNVEYICDRPDTVRSRCERGRFPPIKQVVLRDDGGLRIMLMQGGNWDFYGSHADIKAAYEAISALVTKRGP